MWRTLLLCPKCKIEMNKEVTLEYFIYKCDKCGNRIITDYADKEVDTKTKMLIEDIYNEG